MEEKCINDNIAYIYEQFLEILLMQIRSLYEEYDETYLDEFELKYRNNYKELINRRLNETDLQSKIKELLSLEPDPYGLDTMKSSIKFIISDIFREIGIELATESMIIKDKWKKEQTESLTNEIFRLSELIEKYKQEMISLYDDLEVQTGEVERQKEKNGNLKIEIDYISKKLDLTEQNLEKKIKQSNEEISKHENMLKQSEKENLNLSKEKERLESENSKLINEKDNLKKESLKLNEEKENLKDKVDDLERSITTVKKEANNKQNDEYINEINKLKKENEHLKKGVDVLKSQSKDKENELRLAIDEKGKMIIENKELSNSLLEKEKQIRELMQKINKLSSIEVVPKITIDEVKLEYNNIYNGLFTKLKEIVAIDSNKTVGGQRIMPIASSIHKVATSTKGIHDMSTFKTNVEKLASALSQLDSLFEENGKESGLAPYIEKLTHLKDKI